MHNLCEPRALNAMYKNIHLTLNSSFLTQMYNFHGVIKLLHITPFDKCTYQVIALSS